MTQEEIKKFQEMYDKEPICEMCNTKHWDFTSMGPYKRNDPLNNNVCLTNDLLKNNIRLTKLVLDRLK